jgi:hypothetical protein
MKYQRNTLFGVPLVKTRSEQSPNATPRQKATVKQRAAIAALLMFEEFVWTQ